MRRVRLDLSYDGTAFSGWARQPGLRTVAGELEVALARVLRLAEPPSTVVAGRTDAGVHATGQVCHVDLPQAAWDRLPGRSRRPRQDDLVARLAGVLPADVRVDATSLAPPGFDARFSALRRHYTYRLCDALGGVPPLRVRDVVGVRGGRSGALDVKAMDVASAALVGLHDFAAYCRPRPGATTVRTLLGFGWHRPERGGDRDLVVAEVVADAFCHSMVRALVGAALAVGQGRRAPDWPARVLAAGARDGAVTVAPARGLTLTAVDYPPPGSLAARARVARSRRDAPGSSWQPRGMTSTFDDDAPDATPARQSSEPRDHDGVLEMADTQDDRYASAVLDEGYSPRERPAPSSHYGLTAEEEIAGTTLDQRLREEEPEDSGAAPDDGDWRSDSGDDGELLDDEVGSMRSGRLVAPDEGAHEDTEKSAVATDVGIDGGAASAEEAAMHVVAEEDDTEF